MSNHVDVTEAEKKALVKMMKAKATKSGSTVYGGAGPGSDVDYIMTKGMLFKVIGKKRYEELVDQEDSNYDDGEFEGKFYYDGITYDMIVVDTLMKYKAWRAATHEMKRLSSCGFDFSDKQERVHIFAFLVRAHVRNAEGVR